MGQSEGYTWIPLAAKPATGVETAQLLPQVPVNKNHTLASAGKAASPIYKASASSMELWLHFAPNSGERGNLSLKSKCLWPDAYQYGNIKNRIINNLPLICSFLAFVKPCILKSQTYLSYL
jgi:hypothetical protein